LIQVHGSAGQTPGCGGANASLSVQAISRAYNGR
jgi:hypothetical protein